jgi:hypothetical protein
MGIRVGAHAMQNNMKRCEEPQPRLGVQKVEPTTGPAVWASLSLTELDRQLSLSWLDLVQLILALVADSVLKPSGLVIFVVTGGGWALCSYRLEALVEEMGVLVVLGGLLGDFREGARLRDGDQLLVRLSTNALQVLSLTAKLLWVGLGRVVGATGGTIVGLVRVSEQVRAIRVVCLGSLSPS